MSSSPPPFRFSQVGEKLSGHSGINELMDDLGQALASAGDICMLGGGNPAAVPEMQQLWRTRMQDLLAQTQQFDAMLGNYDPPQGNPRFLKSLAALLNKHLGWDIGPENIAVTNGSQTACFELFNLLAGTQRNGRTGRILLPLCPEYIGYADQGLTPELFYACRPEFEWPDGPDGHLFKYKIDFSAVEKALATQSIVAIAVSRPTNPSGNVLTDAEIERLSALAKGAGIPLLIDNAYGAPFPGVIFTEAKPFWEPHVILTLSLSKLGLPGTRTAFVIGPPQIIRAVSSITAIAGLANGNIGQQLVLPLVEIGEILTLGNRCLKPFYAQRLAEARAVLAQVMNRAGRNWACHAAEGAFFLWLWLRDLKGTSREFYERLKARRVLVVPGEYFFFGLEESAENIAWPHRYQCLRLNYAQDTAKVAQGLQIIAEEASRAC